MIEGRICVINGEIETRVLIRIFEEGECENRAQGKRGLSIDEAPKKMDRGDVMQRAGGPQGRGTTKAGKGER